MAACKTEVLSYRRLFMGSLFLQGRSHEEMMVKSE
jgi:hypothetical protein